ncbi:integrase catalytic domain-containing protein [Trichonephila clavipes]|nr:integrase catalytic domain-containing protein [Trichonephila clavipes]
MLAWMLRFVKNCRHPDKRVTNHLTVSELDAAEKVLVKIVQQETLKNENVEPRLKTLCIFTDSNGLIRLKTKINCRDDAENFINTLLLPSDHPLVERLIFERHLQSSHAGTQVVLTDIHQKFWLLRGRKTVQRVISKRFIAKRGRPKIIYSDNGTNFTGANNRISALDWDRIVDAASVLRIQWKFNPPTAAWWGGFWDRLIQMVKKLLRVLGKASLYYKEIFTILCDIEATINSRPLNCLSEDPNDLTPLMPSMFIQETRTVGVPDLDNLHKINISKRYQYQQAL